MRGTQTETWAFESFEAPMSAKDSLRLWIQLAGVQPVCINQESAAGRARYGRKIHASARFALDMKNEIVRDVGREHQRSALDGKNQGRLLQAEYFLYIHRPKRRELGSFDRGQSHYQYGLWFAERRRIIQPEVQLLLLRQRERWYVLIFRRMDIVQNARQVYDRPHVCAVKSAARER